MAAVLLLFSLALAQEKALRILEAEKLELRQEGGEEVYVLTGNPVRLERDGEAIEAGRATYFRTRKLLFLSEGVRYRDREGRLVEAEELQIDLSDESFDALEVRIEAKDLLLTGPLCQRVAGAILLENGYATPCASCGQEVPDYAFRAREIVLYPGDRVVARGVVVLVQEKPVLELPVLLLFLSERRPRFEVGQDEGGFYLKAALPYVADFGLGFTLLSYYQGRGYGFGFDHYGTGEAKERYFFLHTPPDTFQYRGEYALKRQGFSLSALVERDDTREKLTRFRLEASSPSTPTPQDWRYALREEATYTLGAGFSGLPYLVLGWKGEVGEGMEVLDLALRLGGLNRLEAGLYLGEASLFLTLSYPFAGSLGVWLGDLGLEGGYREAPYAWVRYAWRWP
ncbi:hypothetical protein CSW48_06075 [Thermus scotoductus]|nr:hypothetical protein CSW48_06075 [Thermus scotoductus]